MKKTDGFTGRWWVQTWEHPALPELLVLKDDRVDIIQTQDQDPGYSLTWTRPDDPFALINGISSLLTEQDGELSVAKATIVHEGRNVTEARVKARLKSRSELEVSFFAVQGSPSGEQLLGTFTAETQPPWGEDPV
jgi:hypothetical protein